MPSQTPLTPFPRIRDRSVSSPMSSADVEEANALKLQGNKAFQQHDWQKAVEFYTQAIEKYDKEPSFFCNRAQV